MNFDMPITGASLPLVAVLVALDGSLQLSLRFDAKKHSRASVESLGIA